MYIYNWPMASAGVGAFYYYKKEGEVFLFLQKRSEQMYHAPGEIDVTGGYIESEIQKDGTFESLPESLLRETGEEIGWDFVKLLPKNAFTMQNIALIRQKAEEKFNIDEHLLAQLGKKFREIFNALFHGINKQQQMNFSFIWVLEITEEVANKAIIADDKEVAELIHINIKDIYNNPLIRPWIKEHVPKLINVGYFQ